MSDRRRRWTVASPQYFSRGEAGLVIQEQFGNWDRQRLTDTSPEIITIARLAEDPNNLDKQTR